MTRTTWDKKVTGLPTRPMEGHVLIHGRRGQVSTPNTDGWRDILQQQESRPMAALTEKQLP
jgi:hypothetical protein